MNADFSISGITLAWIVGITTLLLITLIYVARFYLNRKSDSDLTAKYKDKVWDSPLTARSKYPDVDVLRHSGTMMRIGMAISLGLLVLAFNWTSVETEVFIPDNALDLLVDLEVEPPQTTAEPPPPPPPPPPVIEEVPNELILEAEDDIEFVDQSITAESAIEAPVSIVNSGKENVPPPPPPPPPPPEPKVAEIFKVVEEMPRFPGCEDLAGTIAEKKACADARMLEFLYEHLHYPNIARENNISGTVVVQFVVNEDGSITGSKVVRDIGGGCGDEALRVVQLMNDQGKAWTPGRQRGRAVKVMFSLPVKFVLRET